MHNTALHNGEKFVNKYTLPLEGKKVIDLGSMDNNGSLKPFFEKANYIGVDMTAGNSVDIVANNHDIPFKDNYFDICISTSCFEHDDMFWVTFLEMCRIVKPGGLIYLNVPSTGEYHGFPGDCWRFYLDSYEALGKWAIKNNYNIELLESYVDDTDYAQPENWLYDSQIGKNGPQVNQYHDCVGIFQML